MTDNPIQWQPPTVKGNRGSTYIKSSHVLKNLNAVNRNSVIVAVYKFSSDTTQMVTVMNPLVRYILCLSPTDPFVFHGCIRRSGQHTYVRNNSVDVSDYKGHLSDIGSLLRIV